MKFNAGDRVKHKLTKELYIIVECYRKRFMWRKYTKYQVTQGKKAKLQYGGEFNMYFNMYESELEK